MNHEDKENVDERVDERKVLRMQPVELYRTLTHVQEAILVSLCILFSTFSSLISF